jgi:hypothetical protein
VRKSYSLIDWLIVVAAALAIAAAFRSGLKREIDRKVRGTADLMLWTGWHTPVPVEGDEFKNDRNTRSKSGSSQYSQQVTRENTDGSMIYDVDSDQAYRSASISVAEEQRYLLSNNSLHGFGFNIDSTND